MSLSKPEFVAFKSDGVWTYFLGVKTKDKFGEKALCLKCSKVYACTGLTFDEWTSTQNLGLRYRLFFISDTELRVA